MKIHYEQTRHTDENFTKDKEHSWLAIFFCKNHPSCPRSSSRVSNRMTRNGSWAPTDVLISFWLFTDTCCSLSLIKLGNNRWRNACSTSTSSFLARPPSLGYFAISSSPSIRSLSFSLSYLDLSSLLSGVRSPRSPRSGVARMCGVGSQGRHTVGSGTRQGHGYQLLVSSPSFSPHVSPFLSPRFCPSLSFLPPGSLSCLGSRPFPSSRRRAAILGNV